MTITPEQIAAWIAEYFASVEHRGMRYEAFIADKAYTLGAESMRDRCAATAQAMAPSWDGYTIAESIRTLSGVTPHE